jgi:hypothetical protein
MKIQEIQNLANRKPFRPFTVNLINGDRIPIDRSDDITFPSRRPELVIVFTSNGQMHIFEDVGIASIEEPQST